MYTLWNILARRTVAEWGLKISRICRCFSLGQGKGWVSSLTRRKAPSSGWPGHVHEASYLPFAIRCTYKPFYQGGSFKERAGYCWLVPGTLSRRSRTFHDSLISKLTSVTFRLLGGFFFKWRSRLEVRMLTLRASGWAFSGNRMRQYEYYVCAR